MAEIFERIEDLKFYIKNYKGWNISYLNEWIVELRQLRKVVKNGAIL